MENEELIRREVEAKRAALTEKLETLEEEVVGTVKEATAAVSDTVESIKDSVQETVSTVKDTVQETVSTVKDTVQDTVSTVKETVHDSVESVKDWFDVSAHVDNHPWLMVGGSVALGYYLGNLLKPPPVASAQESPRPTHSGNGHHREKRQGGSQGSAKKAFNLGSELSKLKALALGALLGTVRDMVVPKAPDSMKQPLKEIFDSVTEKIGGEAIARSEKQTDKEEKPQEEKRPEVQQYHKRFAQP